MRAIIRVIIPKTTDEEVLRIKKEIEKVVKDIEGVEVTMSTMV